MNNPTPSQGDETSEPLALSPWVAILSRLSIVVLLVAAIRLGTAIVSGVMAFNSYPSGDTRTGILGTRILSFASFGEGQGVLLAVFALLAVGASHLVSDSQSVRRTHHRLAAVAMCFVTGCAAVAATVGYIVFYWDETNRWSRIVPTAGPEASYALGLIGIAIGTWLMLRQRTTDAEVEDRPGPAASTALTDYFQ